MTLLESTQAMKLNISHNKFGEKILCNLQATISLQKNSRDQIDEITVKLHLSKNISHVCSNFILCREICKQYVVTNSTDWSMADV